MNKISKFINALRPEERLRLLELGKEKGLSTEIDVPINLAPRHLPLQPSFAQQRLWFLDHFEGTSTAYHIPLALRLHGRLDVPAWQQSLDAIFARHEALRSTFVARHGQPYVELLAPDHGLALVEHDLRGVPDAEQQVDALCREEAQAPFDLAAGPLVRARLIRLQDEEYVALLTKHHIVSDGWSMGILVQELSAMYSAFSQGTAPALPPLAIHYPDSRPGKERGWRVRG
jgi:hypothetical protein